jgi:hypothetical protein
MFPSLHGRVWSPLFFRKSTPDTRSENALNLSLSGLRGFSKRGEAGALGHGYVVVLRFVVGATTRGSSGTITQNKT